MSREKAPPSFNITDIADAETKYFNNDTNITTFHQIKMHN